MHLPEKAFHECQMQFKQVLIGQCTCRRAHVLKCKSICAQAEGQTCPSRRTNVHKPRAHVHNHKGKHAQAEGHTRPSRRANVPKQRDTCAQAGGQMCTWKKFRGPGMMDVLARTNTSTFTLAYPLETTFHTPKRVSSCDAARAR